MDDLFDAATAREALAGPGIDPRQWIAHGIVEPDTSDGHAVTFVDGEGNPHPNGILVQVKLVQSGIVVPCRVAMHSAGSGEAEYSPFGPGDEVLVAIADGDERAGCYIVGRMANVSDAFPQTVAGQDVTQNSVTFKRIVTPYILETASSLLFRQAKTGASWSIDPTGNLMFNDGEGNLLALNQSVLLLQEASGEALVQIDPEKKTVALQSNATALLLDDANGSSFLSGTTLSIVTSGGGYTLGHAVTLEQMVAFVTAVLTPLSTGGVAPVTGAQVATAILAIAGVVLPAGPSLTPADIAAIQATLASPNGFGRAGLLF